MLAKACPVNNVSLFLLYFRFVRFLLMQALRYQRRNTVQKHWLRNYSLRGAWLNYQTAHG